MSCKIGNGLSSKSEEDYIISIPSSYVPNEKGMGYVYFEAMKKYKDNVVQYIVDTGEEDTFSELLERCVRVSLNLRDQFSLDKDDVVMLCTDNHINSCVPLIASVFLGIPVAALDPSLSEIEMEYYLNETRPKVLFVIPKILSVVEGALSKIGITTDIIVFGESAGYKHFKDFLKPHKDEEIFTPVSVKSLEDPLVIVFSSGTTTLPKGIVLNHYTIGAQSYMFSKPGSKPVMLFYSTFFWISGVRSLSISLVTGGAKVLCSKFDPKEIWNLIDKYKVTNTFLIPPLFISMLEAGRPEFVDTSSLKALYTGGSPISENYLKELRKLLPGTIVLQSYGQSEIAGTLISCRGPEEYSILCNKPNSVGMPLPGFTCKVVDLETESLCGPNQHGELRIKSKIMMNGYYKRDSSQAFDSDGWLKTGDILYYDEDNCFYMVDRIKEMLKYRGLQVAPAIIEKILLDHPDVQQAVVIGVPHPSDGDHPMAIIVLSNMNGNKVTEEEIENFVAERLSDRMKLRGGVRFLDALPLTPTGKVKRKELRDMFSKGKF